MTAGSQIAGRTLSEWQEFARRDDCLDRMVPSDLRALVGRLAPTIAAKPPASGVDAVAEPVPYAWVRRFAYDGVDVMKMRDADRPRGWHLMDVTRSKFVDDDVPLYTRSAPSPAATSGSEAGGEMRAQITPFSSVVGQSVLLTDETGAALAQLSISIPDPNKPYRETAEEIARVIELAINQPPSEEVKRLRVRLGDLMIEDAKRMAALAKPASSPAGRVWTVKGWLPNGDGCEFTFGDESEYLRFMASKPATFDVSDIEELVVSSCGRALASLSTEVIAPAAEPVEQYRWRDYGTDNWSPWFEGPLPQDCEVETRTLYATPPAPAAVDGQRVKALVWNEYETEGEVDRWDAETALGTFYEISTQFDGYHVARDCTHLAARFDTLDEAKAAAQADYEQRIRSALSPAATPVSEAGGETFQQRVQPWMMACFGAEISADVVERNHRFLEEALELVQSTGCTASEAHQLVDYVYGRDVGETHQEIGGVMVTLAALCLALGEDMHAAGETELVRIWTKVEKIRAKQAAKPKHSPLPQHVATPPAPAAVDGQRVKDGWQPLETAPKDGTPFLGYLPADRFPAVCFWQAYDQADAKEIGADGYWAFGEELISHVEGHAVITHWRPLPEPPSAMLAAAGGRDE